MNKTKELRSLRAVKHVLDYDAWFTSEVEKDWQRLTEANLSIISPSARWLTVAIPAKR